MSMHEASDNYLSCSKRACPTWLDSHIYKYVNICHTAVLKHTLNTDLSPLTYKVHFIVVYTNITTLTIHITLFLIGKNTSTSIGKILLRPNIRLSDGSI